jgi:hypothetical protein
MPADDLPIDALKKHFELEDSSVSPITSMVLDVVSRLPSPWPIDKAITFLKDRIAADSKERIRIMLETCNEVLRKHDERLRELSAALSEEEREKWCEMISGLVLDAARRAVITRAKDRVKRLGLILANGVAEPKQTDGDEVEEMMRIAMEVNDNDLHYLGELVRIERDQVVALGRIPRYPANRAWELGFWGADADGEIDSVFSKLESYGLVSRIPPPTNVNSTADFQNRYALLKKGLRFVNLIQQEADQ